MTGTGLAGLLGGVIAAWVGGRFGRNWPIAIGITLNVVAAVGLALGDDAVSYIGLNFLWNAAYYFVVPYLMGALAAMDDLGRWAVASDGAWTLGDALGPGIAGTLVAWGGYGPLAGMALVSGFACLVVLSLVLRSFDAKQRAAGGD
jgi:MFS family permease